MPDRSSATTTDPRLAAALGFQRAMCRRAASRVVDVRGAFAFLRPEIERSYSENAFYVTDAAGRDAAAIEKEAEHFLGGMRHRMIFSEDGTLEDGFRVLGYDTTRVAVMAHSLDQSGLETRSAGEVSRDEALAALDVYFRTDPDFTAGRDDETRAHMLEHHRSYGERAGVTERFIGVRAAGSVVAWAKLWERRGVAQIEDVVCLFEHRGHGFGRDVVAAAALAALAESPEVLFILADGADWPQDLYARMGFDEIGSQWEFVRG